MKILRLIVIGFTLVVCSTVQADVTSTAGSSTRQKDSQAPERPTRVFVDGSNNGYGTSRGSSAPQAHPENGNAYEGLGRQGDAPLAEVYTPAPPPKPTCQYHAVMSDDELAICRAEARASR